MCYVLLQREIVRLQETHEADLHHLRSQLEEQVLTIQRLTTQLRENEERMREKDVKLREMEERLTQLQQKDVELKQKNSDISRLQREVPRINDISTQSTEAPILYRCCGLIQHDIIIAKTYINMTSVMLHMLFSSNCMHSKFRSTVLYNFNALSIFFIHPDTTIKTEATSKVEMEERQGPAISNIQLGISGCDEGEGVHWRRRCIIR